VSEHTTDILVFGGSFDPPHHAHITLPLDARNLVGARQILFIPTGSNPQKEDPSPTDPRHRVAMLEHALANEPRVVVSSIELDRPMPHYTIDTLKLLRAQPEYRNANMRLLIGADQALNFQSWRDWRRVIELAEPLVMPRPPYSLDALPDAYEEAHPGEASSWVARTIDLPLVDESSTDVREAVVAGIPLETIVPEAVASYIKEHSLYGFSDRPATID
jgi:nicotinate-nucleotide adenylyltransferase